MNNSEALTRLKTIFAEQGVRPALIFLNGLTDHRFTALYLFDHDWLQCLQFFDREHPEVESSPEVPVTASYCVFVRDRGRTFATSDSMTDERVRGHPKRRMVRSYCGVPLLDEDGRMFGTICHFDFQAISITDANVDLMEAVAPLLKHPTRILRDQPAPLA